MNFGAILFRFVVLITILGVLVSCRQNTEPDSPEVFAPTTLPTETTVPPTEEPLPTEAPTTPPTEPPPTVEISESELEPEVTGNVLGEQLIEAVEAGDTAEVGRLLDAGANPDFVASNGDVPLPVAARDGYLEIVQLLLDAGADVNGTMRYWLSPSIWELVEAPALIHAAFGRHVEIVELLIANGADVNQAQGGSGETALHFAAWRSAPEIITLLLDNGANPDLQITAPWAPQATPLNYAIGNGSLSAGQALLDGGTSPNLLDGRGLTPLMDAMTQQFSNEKMINFVTALLEGGADPNLQDPNGDAALHYAVKTSQNDLIPILIEFGAAMDLQNSDGNTPLHIAARTNRAETVSILLEQGASVTIENDEGQTAIDAAATDEIAELLREVGVGE